MTHNVYHYIHAQLNAGLSVGQLQSTHVQITNQLIPFHSIMVTHRNFAHTTNPFFFFISFDKWFQENNKNQHPLDSINNLANNHNGLDCSHVIEIEMHGPKNIKYFIMNLDEVSMLV